MSDTDAARCDDFFENETQKEDFNKQFILDFYRVAINDPPRFPILARHFYIPNYIQHDATTADGIEARIAAYVAVYGNSTRPPVPLIRNVAADGDLVWVHEKDVNPKTNNERAVVNIYR